MTYEQSRLLKPSSYSWSGDFCFRVWDTTHVHGSVWDRRQRNQRDNMKTGRCFDIVWLWRLLNSSNTQTTVSSLTHISWQADLSMDFRTLLRWTTPDTPLLLLGEKLPSALDNRDAAWSSKSTSKFQTTTNSHRCSDWSCETHLSTKTSKCALTRIRTASSVCAHIQRSSITACRGDRLTGQWKIWRIGGNSWLMQGFSCHIIFPNTPT